MTPVKPYKIETTVAAFVAALKLSIKAEKKTSVPVLTCAHILGNVLTVTDLDLWSVVEFEATFPKRKDDKGFLFPYHQALAVLQGESGPLTIEPLENNWTRFTVNDCDYKLPGFDTGQFPPVPEVAKSYITLTGDAFRTLLDRAMFAIFRGASRYALNGALFVPGKDKFEVVATDGHRLSLASVPYDGEVIDRFLVTYSALEMLKSRVNGSVKIGIEGDWQIFKTAGATFFARKLSGQFPDYEAVMPRNTIKTTIDSASKLVPILARVAKCADERSGAVRFAFEPDGLVLSASSNDRGEAKATVPVYTKDGFTIGLNSAYVGDFLKKVGDRPVGVELRDAQSSILFRADDDAKGETFVHVVMPMRI